MAHGRPGPDIVMTIRYAGASEIRSVTDHEINRTTDGSSAIDPARSHLNEILHGPKTQQEAVQKMWADGVRPPAKQAEDPYVQIVLSASPEYFREEGQGPGEWSQDKLDAWKAETIAWLKAEYGDDLAHVSMHLDEDTPHMHVLVIPTYARKARKPSRRKKSGETEAEFAERLTAWEADPGSTRTAGRSSSPYWSRMWCRLEARKSYHRALEKLGLGYGKDFVGVDEPSPEHKTTRQWVREQAALLAEREADLDKRQDEIEAMSARADVVMTGALALVEDVKNDAIYRNAEGKLVAASREKIAPAFPELWPATNAAADAGTALRARSAELKAGQAELKDDRDKLDHRETILRKSVQLFETLVVDVAKRLGATVGRTAAMTLDNIKVALAPPPEPEVSVLDQIEAARSKRSAPAEQARPKTDGGDGLDDGPGF